MCGDKPGTQAARCTVSKVLFSFESEERHIKRNRDPHLMINIFLLCLKGKQSCGHLLSLSTYKSSLQQNNRRANQLNNTLTH